MISRHGRGEVVRLFLNIVSAGAGVLGQIPTVAIQRRKDGTWFQVLDGTWQPTVVENPMTETSPATMPGRYQFDFDQSLDVLTDSKKYNVKKTNVGPPLVLEYEDLVFGPVPGAAALNLCSVQGTIFDAMSVPLSNRLVRATLIPVFKDALGRTIEADRVVDTYSNILGAFDLPLVRGAIFRLEINSVGFDRKVTIPDQSSVLFTDL